MGSWEGATGELWRGGPRGLLEQKEKRGGGKARASSCSVSGFVGEEEGTVTRNTLLRILLHRGGGAARNKISP